MIITNATILTMNATDSVYEDSGLAIKNNIIVDIGSSEKIRQLHAGEDEIDAAGGIVMPGLINTHTHAAMVYFRGLADDLLLKPWLEDYIWPAERKFVNKKFISQALITACAEMIKSGTTLFNDMYFFEAEAAEVLAEVGIRGVLGEVLFDLPGPNTKTPQEGLDYTKQFIRKWKDHDLIYPAVAPHSPYACSAELLQESKSLADQYGAVFHIHVAETRSENEMIGEKVGSEIAYLDELGCLGSNVIACHAVWISNKDQEVLSERGVKIAHCPVSNMKLASGIAPVPDMIDRKILVGLGTDGASSNNSLNMFRTMDMTAKLHKLYKKDPAVLPARKILKMATIEGAKILGLEQELGSLETGKKADMIIIDTSQPHLIPLFDPMSLIYTAKRSDVNTVIVDGKILMQNRKLITIDENETIQNAIRYGHYIKEEIGN